MNTKQQKSIDPLGEIQVEMKTGPEKFFNQSSNPNLSVLNFWQWSSSDLLTNIARGILAEFLVASALDLVKNPRIEWKSYDLKLKSDVKIEIKSSAKYQKWEQSKPSPISFSISKKKLDNIVDPSSEPNRWADIYVFCVLNAIEPMNLDNWDFYVLQTEHINERCDDQQEISLSSLKDKFPELKKCRFDELRHMIDDVERRVLLRRICS